MELRTCEFCGTEYEEGLQQCPLCGKAAGKDRKEVPVAVAETSAIVEERPKRRVASSGGARLAPKGRKTKDDSIPRGMWIAICAVLGAAVLIGFLYFLYIMGAFGGRETSVQEPDNLPEYNYENQVDELEPSVSVGNMDQEETDEQEEQDSVIPDIVTCTGLTISKDEAIMDEAGGKFFLTAVARPSDCEEHIIYASSDETVVTVNENGMITAVGPGDAEIIVTCGEQIKICVIHCVFETVEPEEEIPEETDPEEETEEEHTEPPKLSTEDFTLFYPGEEAYLTVENVPDGVTVSYVSSNASVATVSADGKVTAVGNGTATITVTVGDKKLSCIARCNLGSTTEGGVTGSYSGPFTVSNEYGALTANDMTLSRAGETCTLSLVDSNGKKVTGLSWTTSNGGVCSINANGKLTAVGSGTATVSVVYGGQTYKVTVRCSF